MHIRLLYESDLPDAIHLIWEVFEEFEAPIYPQKGINSFKDFISLGNITNMYRNHTLLFWGCFMDDILIGVIALRGFSHLSLLFVKKEWHHKGIATYLFQTLLGYAAQNKQIDYITVNASPYATGFYKTIGFYEISEEKVIDGIRFTPMEYKILYSVK